MAISMSQAVGLVVTIGVIGIVLGAVATSLNSFSSTLTAGTSARAAVDNATLGIGNFAVQMPVIGTIAAVAIIISLVVGGLMVFGSGSGRGGR